MDDGSADVTSDSGQRPGSPRGSRAVVVPRGDPRPPAAWAPAALTAHVVLLFLLAVVSTFLWAAGVESSTL